MVSVSRFRVSMAAAVGQAPAPVDLPHPAVGPQAPSLQVHAAEPEDAPTVISIDPIEVEGEDPPPEIDEVSGVPKTLRSYVVTRDPGISVIPHLLTDAEIAHLLELAEPYWTPSTVGSGVYKTNDESKDLANIRSKNRTSYSCMLRSAQTPMVERIERRLAQLAGLGVEHLERLNMVRYHPGQLFNRHHDGRFRPKTLFIYLNDLPAHDGGETVFPKAGVKFVPRRGCGVLWSNVLSPGVEDNMTIHQGLPPKSGVKYGVNCFFNEKKMTLYRTSEVASGRTSADVTVDPATLVPTATGTEKVLDVFEVWQAPDVSVAPRFLSQREIALLLSSVDISASGTPPSEGEFPDSDVMLAQIKLRLAAFAGVPSQQLAAVRVSRCDANMAPDGIATCGDEGYTEKYGHRAVCMFLNEVDLGGELTFPRIGLCIRPRTGCAVTWSVAPAGEGHGITTPTLDMRAAHQCTPPGHGQGPRFAAMAVFRNTLADAAPDAPPESN